MSFGAEDVWLVDGMDLRSFAWNVEALSAGEGLPARRGQNLVVPFRHGARWHPKYYAERGLTLSMFVTGCDPDTGTVPVGDAARLGELYRNLDTLRQVFGTTNRLLELTRVLPNGEVRTAQAEVVGTLDFDSVSGAMARFTVDLLLPDPFWYGPQSIQRAVWGYPRYGMRAAWGGDLLDGLPLGYDLFDWRYGEGHLYGTPWTAPQVWSVDHDGNYQTSNLVLHVHGICANPRVTHSNGTYVEVLTTMVASDVLVIDCENFTAEKNGSSVIGSLRHAGDPAFMVLFPGPNALTLQYDVEPAAVVTAVFAPRYL